MSRKISIKGPLEKIDGKLLLQIPLAAGGRDLVDCTKGIGRVDGEFLKIEILPWMAGKHGVSEGTIMAVDNFTGKFRMERAVAT
ncbi:MAG: hypothetical protein JWM32_415 [Verrucomicrobia bacterium]|nr:hypothetical protein [Verrucomicrobiota bacterium]